MHRLRHPIRSITEPYGKAGLLVAILALVLATTGAAFAAAGLNSKQKKEVTKIAKKYAGKPGATGPQGPAGANGTNGEKGAQGEKGAKGDTGATGPQGPIGNTGPAGPTGPEGALGTAGTTLPSNATETGNWVLSGKYAGFNLPPSAVAPVSFPIPLATALDAEHVHAVNPSGEEEFFEEGEPVTRSPQYCHGSVAAPEANSGNLCVYVGAYTGDQLGLEVPAFITKDAREEVGALTSGAWLGFFNSGETPKAYGTFAVTG
jgi:hypothetical protein